MKNYQQIQPYCCLKKAYEVGKHIRRIKKNYLSYRTVLFRRRRSWRSILFYTNTELNNSVFRIYLNLLGYRIGLYFLELCRFLRLCSFFCGKILNYESCGGIYKNHSIFTDPINRKLIKRINRKLTWIEAILSDLYTWKRYYLLSPSLIDIKKESDEYSSSETEKSESVIMAHESIGLLPRSITRTISRFKAELTNQSESLLLREFGLARYQALVSLQYIGCLIIIPSIISILSQKYLSEPWINYWWNNKQSQIFLAPPQEDKALEELERIEELFWLDKVVENASFRTPPQSLDNGIIHEKIIELVKNHNDNSIEIISHSLTDIIYLTTLSGLFIAGEERLAISNSWVQELFHSLSDTMKAFSILLLTDLCIGFHSPHGWELAMSFCLEHFGFVHDGRIISCFVSTFPVVLDTVLKYLIFRHLNRISPSIVATYHTMNE